MKGPPKTPTAKARLRGFPGKRAPSPHEPQPTPANPDPPRSLTGAAREIWLELAPELIRIGCLTSIDRREFAKACRYEAEHDRRLLAIEQGPVTEARLRGEINPSTTCLAYGDKATRIFARMGIGASDRTRIQAPAPVPEGKWAALVS